MRELLDGVKISIDELLDEEDGPAKNADFLCYQRVENKSILYGLIGKKYISSVIKTEKTPELIRPEIISRNYFLNKPVCVEVAHKKGLLKGFFDFRNDDYLNVTINTFREGKVYLELSGRCVLSEQRSCS